ncbi:hypothetical protein WR25_01491 [Diploscapter pachys]|uniref:Uncharacterized protein n=1 Tax=Diploscapter pachys TaxID=2018661 RepID=A0A2A2JQX6_9BILA|nr:hypothetical protein WR25_01491 [Diploscapter pachys]
MWTVDEGLRRPISASPFSILSSLSVMESTGGIVDWNSTLKPAEIATRKEMKAKRGKTIRTRTVQLSVITAIPTSANPSSAKTDDNERNIGEDHILMLQRSEIIEKNADRKKLERKRKNKMNEKKEEIEWAGHMVRRKESEERKKEYKDTLSLSQNRDGEEEKM